MYMGKMFLLPGMVKVNNGSARNVRVGASRAAVTRGVGAGRSAERGTSAAATGPRGRSPHNPEFVLVRLPTFRVADMLNPRRQPPPRAPRHGDSGLGGGDR